MDRNKDNVGKIARVLERVLPKYVSCRNWQTSVYSTTEDTALETLFIEGHTDTTGIDNNNWVLSTERPPHLPGVDCRLTFPSVAAKQP